MLSTEWLRVKSKWSLFILPIIPVLCILATLFQHYQLAVGYHHMPSGSDPLAGRSYAVLMEWLTPDHLYYYAMNQTMQTIYFFPLIFSAVIWTYDDLKQGILAYVATLHRNRTRFFVTKLLSLTIYYALILFFYFIFYTLISFFIPHVPIEHWWHIFSWQTLCAYLIYLSSLLFWAGFAIAITYALNSAIAGTGITVFYLLFERLFTSMSSTLVHQPLLMKINEFLPWANFQSLFLYAIGSEQWTNQLHHKIDLNLSSMIPGMFRLTKTQLSGVSVPFPFLTPLYVLIIVITVYFSVMLYACWTLYHYRINKS